MTFAALTIGFGLVIYGFSPLARHPWGGVSDSGFIAILFGLGAILVTSAIVVLA